MYLFQSFPFSSIRRTLHSLFKNHLLVSLADGSENHLLVTHDVLLVLSFPVNLLSVKKLCFPRVHVKSYSSLLVYFMIQRGGRLVMVQVMVLYTSHSPSNFYHQIPVLDWLLPLLSSGTFS